MIKNAFVIRLTDPMWKQFGVSFPHLPVQWYASESAAESACDTWNCDRFKFEDFNPDAMSLEDLREWLNHLLGHAEDMAKRFFPTAHNSIACINYLTLYCYSKIKACEFRLAGQIVQAIYYEDQCDAFYYQLEDTYRW